MDEARECVCRRENKADKDTRNRSRHASTGDWQYCVLSCLATMIMLRKISESCSATTPATPASCVVWRIVHVPSPGGPEHCVYDFHEQLGLCCCCCSRESTSESRCCCSITVAAAASTSAACVYLCAAARQCPCAASREASCMWAPAAAGYLWMNPFRQLRMFLHLSNPKPWSMPDDCSLRCVVTCLPSFVRSSSHVMFVRL